MKKYNQLDILDLELFRPILAKFGEFVADEADRKLMVTLWNKLSGTSSLMQQEIEYS